MNGDANEWQRKEPVVDATDQSAKSTPGLNPGTVHRVVYSVVRSKQAQKAEPESVRLAAS